MGMKTRAVVRIGFGRRGSGFGAGRRGMGRVSAAYLRLRLRAAQKLTEQLLLAMADSILSLEDWEMGLLLR